MSDFTRRRFLALAGASTAGLTAGGLSSVTGQSKLRKENRPTPTTPVDPRAVYAPADFEFKVQPSGEVEVLSGAGVSLGAFSPSITGGPYEFDQLIHQSPARALREGATAERKTADVGGLLDGLPEPMIPLALHSLTAKAPSGGYEMGILIVAQEDALAEPSPGKFALDYAWSYGTKISNYYIRASLHAHPLSPCVNKSVQHVGLLVDKLNPRTGRQEKRLFNIHVAAWWERTRPCFAIYESEGGFCRNVCDYPTWDKIARYVNEPVSKGVPSWLAWTVAAAIGVAAIGGLTVIPGVPPPP